MEMQQRKSLRDIPLQYKVEGRHIMRSAFGQYIVWLKSALDEGRTTRPATYQRLMKAATDIGVVFGTLFDAKVQQQIEHLFQLQARAILSPTTTETFPNTVKQLMIYLNTLNARMWQQEELKNAFRGYVHLVTLLVREPGTTIETFDKLWTYCQRLADYLIMRIMRIAPSAPQ